MCITLDKKKLQICYLTQLSLWNVKMCSCIRERPLVFTDMWFVAYAPKRTATTIQRLTHWNTGLAWVPEEIYPTVKGLREPIKGNFLYHFATVWFPSMTMSVSELAAEFRSGNVIASPIQPRFGTKRFSSASRLEEARIRTLWNVIVSRGWLNTDINSVHLGRKISHCH
jgi:hypothetical protein